MQYIARNKKMFASVSISGSGDQLRLMETVTPRSGPTHLKISSLQRKNHEIDTDTITKLQKDLQNERNTNQKLCTDYRELMNKYEELQKRLQETESKPKLFN